MSTAKRPLTNLSNNFKSTNQANNLKRALDDENPNSTKKLKNHNDFDQENEKSSVLKKILNNRIFENITNSNLKSSINSSKKKAADKVKSNPTEQITEFNVKNQDEELIEIFNKNVNKQPTKTRRKVDFSDPINYYVSPANLPDDVDDYDLKNIGDINAEAQFAYDIFEYYFMKEKQFQIPDYIQKQTEISKTMRSILVDWIVELQDTLHLNHETIYLSVKIVDQYLSKVKCSRSKFQLLGSTAVLIASKFDSRLCPQINSFLYVCDNAYSKEEMVEMEKDILSKIDFNLSIPLSYRFLRRYARCAGLSMEILTFARYILEMCLLEYDFIKELDSKMASACLLLVFKSKKELNLKWTKTLEFYTKYSETDLIDLMNRINKFIQTPMRQSLKTIKEKYASSTYFEVASNKLAPIKE